VDLKDCIKFANDNPACYLATTDKDQPRVRTFYLWYADESGFYFIPLAGKDVISQLQQNPKVEVCFFNNGAGPAEWKQMRVTGEVEFLEDEKSLERAYENRAWIDAIAGFSVKPFVRPCRIFTGEAHFWTMADDSKEPISF
jgi:uncharacterized pyridoxamine 5'-phosphate oxidase family protein